MKAVALLTALLSLFALSFLTVQQHSVAFGLGYRIGELHNRTKRLKVCNRILRFKVEQRKNPARILEKIAAMNLELQWTKNHEDSPSFPASPLRRTEKGLSGEAGSRRAKGPAFQDMEKREQPDPGRVMRT